MVAAVCVALAAWASGGASASTDSGASAGGFPVTIQNCGRTLTFDEPPSRAVLPILSIAEIFVGLGLGDSAIGRIGGGADEPPVLPEQAADFARIPVVSDTFFPPPKEEMLALRADFFLAYGGFDYDGEAGLATLDELGAAGVQVYTVVCPDEAGGYTNENLQATYRAILDLGTIFGVSDRAQRRVAEMQAQIAEVSQRVSGQPVAKVIAYYDGEGPLELSGGRDTIITQIIEAAGGENVFADTNMLFFRAPLETIAAKQVDAFFIFGRDADAKARFLFDTFPNLQASKDRRVVSTRFTSPGWRNAQTVEDIARQLHPEAFQ